MQLLSCADNMFDWFGWGDWLYLLSAIAELFQAIDAAGVNNDDNVISGCYMLSMYSSLSNYCSSAGVVMLFYLFARQCSFSCGFHCLFYRICCVCFGNSKCLSYWFCICQSNERSQVSHSGTYIFKVLLYLDFLSIIIIC